MAKILLIGRNGQIATYLQPKLAKLGELVVVSSGDLDLSQPDSIAPALDEIQPDLIVNPAAYTAVDKAEEEPELAYAINRDAAGALADWCARHQVPLVHFSTDYVFDGSAEQPYTESDVPAPAGVYGASKLAGERAILHTDAPAIILRTSWVYSNHGKNFYKTMLTLAENRDELSVVADQIGSPSYAGCLAESCADIVSQLLENPQLAAQESGVYHMTNSGQTSWHGFAEALFAANEVSHMTVHAIPTSEYPTPAKRPAFSVLDNTRLQNAFGLQLPSWQDGLAQCAHDASS